MKKTFHFLILLILSALLFLPTSSAQAQGPDPDGDGQVIFGDNYVVESGDTFDGDLVLLGGNVTIEEDATLTGDLVVMGGTITSEGEIDGSVVVMGGQVSLKETAVVTGDVVTIGGQLNREEGAKVEGDIVNNVAPNFTFPTGRIPPTAPDVNPPEIPLPNFGRVDPFGGVSGIFGWAIGLSAFGMLIALFWLPQIQRTGQAIVSQPLMTGGIGLLSVIVGVILVFTILPPIFVMLAWFFGIVAMGSEVGERFTRAINQTWSPVLSIGFGTFLLMLAGGIIGAIPCLGGLILFLLGLIGVGATVITLFGTRPVQLSNLAVTLPPASPPSGQVSGPDAPVG